jgi:hypothetical protein
MMKASHPSHPIHRLFLEHPTQIGESYGEHAFHAVYIAGRLIFAGIACLIHAAVPGLFTRTASNAVEDIDRLMTRRTAAAGQPSAALQRGTGPST